MNYARPITPAFLRECADYNAYISCGLLRTLRLPGYVMDAAGHAIINRGEVFCRVLSCERRSVPLSSTTNLRAHLLGHGINCEVTPSGRVS
ncbi:hypothetical protein N7513_012486 [Penicillium frequentans]|nr:hypothetical protein N7513_012486 [Penicillium glabrum]